MNDLPRAVLSVDGDSACALLGENLQEGEAEVVKIEYTEGKNDYNGYIYERRAAFEALHRLRNRLGMHITYALGRGLGS